MAFTASIGGISFSVRKLRNGSDEVFLHCFAGSTVQLEVISRLLTESIDEETIGILAEDDNGYPEWLDYPGDRRYSFSATVLPKAEYARAIAILDRANQAREFAGLPPLTWSLPEKEDRWITYAGMIFSADANGDLFVGSTKTELDPEAFEVDLSQDETLEAMDSHRPGSPTATLAVAQKLNELRQIKGLPPLPITIDGQPINLENSK
jgi:hypothetical protein